MREPSKTFLQFGPYLLAPVERELRLGGERVQLSPRVFDTLLALASNPGRLLDKNELMKVVWPETVVEENNLNQTVCLLRKALRDGENGTKYIETVPKRGYRFVATVKECVFDDREDRFGGHSSADSLTLRARSLRPLEQTRAFGMTSSIEKSAVVRDDVTQGDRTRAFGMTPSIEENAIGSAERNAAVRDDGDQGDGIPLTNDRPSSLVSHRGRLLLVTAALLIVVCGLAATWRVSARGPDTMGPIRSVAVLPLQSLSSDPNQEYFADGMTDELITDLAQIRELKVVSKTSIMQYKGTRKPLPQIGRELGVDAVVEGSVLRSGDQVRITAQLIRTSTDRHLWAKAYDGDLKNVLTLQASVAEAITEGVRLSLSADERNRLYAARKFDPQAYDLYLRGRYVFARRNEAAFQEAIGYYQQAVAKDPNFSLAYAGLSDCYTLLALFGAGYRYVPDADANARKALELDDSLAEAHTSLAAVHVLDWKWSEAEAEFHRALELNPNSAQAHQWYGNLLLGPMGRHTEAIAELQRARELDPLSLVIITDLGYAYFLAGEDEPAMQEYQKVLATDPSFVPVHFDLMMYYGRAGNRDREMQELAEDAKLTGNTEMVEMIRRYSGQPRRLYEEMAKRYARANGVAAGVNLRLGNREKALAALEKSYEAREPFMIYIKVNPELAALHGDPGFVELEHKVGLE
jgi:TolB-like protein/DNA-binding winged helix-turn-helix (wHTH) protein